DIAWLPLWLQPHQIPVVKDCAKDDGSISLLSCKVLHFSLHLSSVGTSQLSSGQFNDKLKITNCDTNFKDEMKTNSNEGSPSKVIPEAQAVQNNADFKNKEESKTNSEPLSKIEGNKGPRSRKKVNSGNLRNVNIDDVIELSIAASEAMVISEIMSNSSVSDPLPASAVLEAALHVKEARKQLFSEALCASSDRELDESDFLLDLDESTMVDAFDDVGLCITRVIHSPENSIHGTSDFKQEKPSRSSSSCDQGTHVSESCCLETHNENLKNQDVENNAKNSPTNHDLASKPLKCLPPLPTSSADEHIALIQNSIQNVDTSGTKEDVEETPGIVKVGGVALEENRVKRKHIKKLFNQETSFISESIDTTRKCSLSESVDAENEIIESSGTPFITRSACPYNTIRKNNDIVSQDHMKSPFLSLTDPLCSVVPCSLSCNDAHIEEDGKEPVIINTLRDQTSDGFVEDNVPSKTFAQREDFDFPKIVAENSGLSVQRKCSSLKNYSMIMPALDKLKDIVIPFPINGNANHFKYDDKVTIGEPSSFKETNDDNIDVLFRHHESLPPLMLNNKKRRVKACKTKFNGDGADQNLIRLTELNSDYGGKATTLSNVPLESSLSLHPTDKQCLQKKRVQFVEAKHGTKRTKTSKGLKSTNRVCYLRENLESVGWKPSIILSPKKVPTAKFLYGCATNSWMLNFHWLVDSLKAGCLLPPGRYLNLPIQPSEKRSLRVGEPFCFKFRALIFDGIGILLSGKVSFCSKFSNIIKHGGGQVFISLEQLLQNLKVGSCTLGVILVESEASVSRHLRHCGLENNIQTLPASWIIQSLFCGKLIPLKKDRYASLHRIKMPTFPEEQEFDMSQEI
ncbi:hypothetical protein ACMD2_00209, partial [Ananas comosus]